jgi:GrpB-like predicted nucleotidyltransferase (UPF0157 family)
MVVDDLEANERCGAKCWAFSRITLPRFAQSPLRSSPKQADADDCARVPMTRKSAMAGFMHVERLIQVGLGQDYDSMTLSRTTGAWLAAGVELQARVLAVLDGVTTDVEVIGSSSVLGLLAKPIIDLAVGLPVDRALPPITTRLKNDGWIYRGDAGANGGHVFVLEARPWHRVAHLHVVPHDGKAWRDYLSLRDLLRRCPDARVRYEEVKVELARRQPIDRSAYTIGKSEIVASLLQGDD